MSCRHAPALTLLPLCVCRSKHRPWCYGDERTASCHLQTQPGSARYTCLRVPMCLFQSCCLPTSCCCCPHALVSQPRPSCESMYASSCLLSMSGFCLLTYSDSSTILPYTCSRHQCRLMAGLSVGGIRWYTLTGCSICYLHALHHGPTIRTHLKSLIN